MWERRIKFLQELIDSPVEVLGSIWPCLLFMLIITGVPVWLAKKKFSERENLKWKIWFISLPLFCIVLFIFGFCGKKADNFTFENVLGWLGVSILGWLLVMTPVVFLSSKCVVSPGEADDNAGELFEMALKIGKEKREGKKTSELQAEYEQKVKNFEENGRLVSSDDAQFYADDLFDMAMKVGREKREGKDTSKQEAEYEQKLKDLEEISNSNKSNW